jgi:hypothetical protein
MWLETAIRIGGVGMLTLFGINFVVPKMLGWSKQLEAVKPLTRQIFWTYAGYISTTNTLMGLLCTFGAHWLIDGSGLAIAVASYIGLYWTVRVILQFTYYDTTDAPKNKVTALGEIYLVSLFAYLSVLFGYTVYFNFSL